MKDCIWVPLECEVTLGKGQQSLFPTKDGGRVRDLKVSTVQWNHFISDLIWKQMTEDGAGTGNDSQTIHSRVRISSVSRFQQPPAEGKKGDHCGGQLCRSSHTVTTQQQQQNEDMETMLISVGLHQNFVYNTGRNTRLWREGTVWCPLCALLISVLVIILPR